MRQRRRLVAARRQAEEARERLVEELSRLATHDALTGLPNRRLAADRLEQALIRRTPERRVSVLFVDLDRSKQVNDQHGHLCGELLAACARLTSHQYLRAEAGRARPWVPADMISRHRIRRGAPPGGHAMTVRSGAERGDWSE